MASPIDPRRDRLQRRPSRMLEIGPTRDTGLTLGDRSLRSRRSRRSGRARPRDSWIWPLLFVVGAILAAALVSANVLRPASPVEADGSTPATASITAAIRKFLRPTPRFAEYAGITLRLPVPADAITALAFHQASFNHALPMTSLVARMDLATARRVAAERKAAIASGTVPPAAPTTGDVWGGNVIRLWRSDRNGTPDTAADVGAPAGTAVIAPVDGTVVLVRAYKLYGKYDDFEVHILPAGRTDVDVVLLHITDVTVKAGDRVQAGLTHLASVRRLSKLMALQLRTYSGDGGDHTHIQLNRTPGPGTIWVSTPKGPVATPVTTSPPGSADATRASETH